MILFEMPISTAYTEHPPLCSTIKSRRLSLFGHVARMDGKSDANQILVELTLELSRAITLNLALEHHQ